jgi:hypothetical protein
MEKSGVPGVFVITGEAGTWYPVREDEGMSRIDVELDDRAKELAKPHLAAQADFLDWRYGPLTEPSRTQRVIGAIRRIF